MRSDWLILKRPCLTNSGWQDMILATCTTPTTRSQAAFVYIFVILFLAVAHFLWPWSFHYEPWYPPALFAPWWIACNSKFSPRNLMAGCSWSAKTGGQPDIIKSTDMGSRVIYYNYRKMGKKPPSTLTWHNNLKCPTSCVTSRSTLLRPSSVLINQCFQNLEKSAPPRGGHYLPRGGAFLQFLF